MKLFILTKRIERDDGIIPISGIKYVWSMYVIACMFPDLTDLHNSHFILLLYILEENCAQIKKYICYLFLNSNSFPCLFLCYRSCNYCF